MHIESYGCYDKESAITKIFMLPIMHARLQHAYWELCMLWWGSAKTMIFILPVMQFDCLVHYAYWELCMLECIVQWCILRVMHAMIRGRNNNDKMVIWQRRLEKWNSYIASLCAQGCKLRRPTSTSVVGIKKQLEKQMLQYRPTTLPKTSSTRWKRL